MKKYFTITHITSNENGEEEIILETEQPMWKVLLLNSHAYTSESFILVGTNWVKKTTGEKVKLEKQVELNDLQVMCKNNLIDGYRSTDV